MRCQKCRGWGMRQHGGMKGRSLCRFARQGFAITMPGGISQIWTKLCCRGLVGWVVVGSTLCPSLNPLATTPGVYEQAN